MNPSPHLHPFFFFCRLHSSLKLSMSLAVSLFSQTLSPTNPHTPRRPCHGQGTMPFSSLKLPVVGHSSQLLRGPTPLSSLSLSTVSHAARHLHLLSGGLFVFARLIHHSSFLFFFLHFPILVACVAVNRDCCCWWPVMENRFPNSRTDRYRPSNFGRFSFSLTAGFGRENGIFSLLMRFRFWTKTAPIPSVFSLK